MQAEFRTRRRQKYLTAKYFHLNELDCRGVIERNVAAQADGGIEPSNSTYSDINGSSFKNALKLVRLHFTAGEPVESLRPLFFQAIHWFRAWHVADIEYTKHLASKTGQDLRLDMTPIPFEDLFQFQLVLDLISLGILLGEFDSVREAAKLMHVGAD